MRSDGCILLFTALLALFGCHGSPTDTGPPLPATLTVDFPGTISLSQTQTVRFGVSAFGAPDVGEWEHATITFDVPGALDWKTVRVIQVDGEVAQIIAPFPENRDPVFEIVIHAPGFGPGQRVSFQGVAALRSDAEVAKTYSGQVEVGVSNSETNRDSLSLGMLKFSTRIVP